MHTHPWVKGSYPVKSVSGAVDAIGDPKLAHGFIVGVPGSEEVPVITLRMHDQSILPIYNVQPGVPYQIPFLAVTAVSAGMDEVYALTSSTTA